MLVGDWAMEGNRDAVLTLRSDGTLSLAGNDGRYWVEGPVLIASLGGGREERFDWELRGADLVLSGAGLSAPMRYRRRADASPSATMLTNKRLVGHWRGGGHFLVFTLAGTVVLDALEGTYVAKDGGLVLMLRGEAPRRLKYRLRKSSLVLSGGEFGSAMQMLREWGPAQP